MPPTGIGAPVRRKEDHRFITGRGHYTDDINRSGQSHAWFLRSPHAHAAIKRIDANAAARMPGGGLRCDRRTACDGQDWQSHLRLDDYVEGRLAHEDGATPAIARSKVNHVGDAVAVVIAETIAAIRTARPGRSSALVFAPKPDMQLDGRGLRRRLAPLLGNDRRRIELAFSLLQS